MTNILIEEIVNKAITDKNKGRHRQSTSFWISSAYYCYRKRYWSRTNVPATNPPAMRGLRVFHVGNLFHKWIQDEVRKYAKSYDTEYYLNDDQTFGGTLSGYIDCIASFDGKQTTLYELKSVNSNSFKFMEKKKWGCSMNYLFQAATYRMILDQTKERKIDSCRVVMVDKDSLRMVEVEVPYHQEVKDAVRKDWEECIGYFKRKELPPATPKEPWECRLCAYRKLCDETEKKK